MADLNDPLPGAGVSFWTMAACLAGSLLSLRALVESAPTTRAVAVIGAFSTGFFLAPAVAEYWALSPKGERAAGLVLAFLGVNLLAGAATFGRKFKDDPASALDWLISLVRGRR